MAKLSKSKLSTIIRKIVREEVAMAIGEVITELKQPIPQQPQRNVQSTDKKSISEKKYSNNPVLNDILNETANDGSMEEWKTMGGETYDSSKMNEVMSGQYGDMMGNKPNADQMVSSMGVSPERIPDNIKDALTKDYSSLLKKMDEKAKVSRGG